MNGVSFNKHSILESYDSEPTLNSNNLVSSGNIRKFVDDTSSDLKNYTDEKIKQIGFVTPEMFGAKGDGVTDDTSSINQAIQYVKTSTIKGVKLSSKTYLVAGTIDLSDCKGVDIIGVSHLGRTDSEVVASQIKYIGTGTCFLFSNTYHCTITGIAIWHASNADSSIAIRYGGRRCQRNNFYDCTIFGFNKGVVFNVGTGYDTFRSVHFSNCVRGFVLNHTEDTIDRTAVNYLYVDRCAFAYLEYTPPMDIVCIEINEAEYLYITHCDFIAGTAIYTPSTSESYQLHDIYIKDNIFFACLKSVEILSRVLRLTLRDNIHRLGVHNGAIAVKISGATNSQNVLIDDEIQYYNKSNIAFPFMIFEKVYVLDFRCDIPANESITGESGEVYPLSLSSTTVINDNYLVSGAQYYTAAPGTVSITITKSKFNWIQPNFLILPYTNNSDFSNITALLTRSGRQCSLSITNSGSSNVTLWIKPVYPQG